MGHSYPAAPTTQRVVSGVRIINGKPCMRSDSEERYVYGKHYYNPETHEIKNE